MSFQANREAELRQLIERAQQNLNDLAKVPETDTYEPGDVIFCRILKRNNEGGEECVYALLKGEGGKWYHTGLIHHGFGGFMNMPFSSWDDLLTWLFKSNHAILEWSRMVRVVSTPPYGVPVYEGPETDLSASLECTHGGDCQLHPNINGLHGEIVNRGGGCS